MRKALSVAALVVGVCAGVLPVTSASAYCDRVLYAATGDCTNLCKILTPTRPCLQ
jgi:hypothetical protein